MYRSSLVSKKARQLLEVLGVPLAALISPQPRLYALLHLTASERRAVRSIPGLNISCETKLMQLRLQLAATLVIATGTFKVGDMVGAYVTDPDRFIMKVILGDRSVPASLLLPSSTCSATQSNSLRNTDIWACTASHRSYPTTPSSTTPSDTLTATRERRPERVCDDL
jgi:hypothetical protein